MKIFKYVFSFLIIYFTTKLLISMSRNLQFDFYSFIILNFEILILVICVQIQGIFLTTLRWEKSIKYFSNNPNLRYNFSEFLFLSSRANTINNFLPSILFGDLSKLISSNKKNKKQELKFIVFDRFIGLFTLGNLGLLSIFYIDLIHINSLILLILIEFLLIFILFKIKFKIFNEIKVYIFTFSFFKIIFISIFSQLFFSFSLFILFLSLKIDYEHLYSFFTSLFLNFVGMFPFSINGWGVREWSAKKISLDQLNSNNLIIASIIFGISISLSNLLVYIICQIRKIKN